jgi:hypothetical protein
MLAFSRLTSILLFVLSLSFLTCAAPTAKSQGLALRGADVDANALLAVCVDAKVAIQAQLDACGMSAYPKCLRLNTYPFLTQLM